MKRVHKILLIFFVFSMLMNTASFVSDVEARRYLFKTNSSLTISSETDDLGIVEPDGNAVSAEITISYKYERFSRPTGFPFLTSAQPTMINLSIESFPEWCSVELDKESFEIPVDTFLTGKTTNVTATLTARISLSADPPAFNPERIELKATAEENGNIESSFATHIISIQSDFVPGLEASISNSNITLNSNEEKSISITVKNEANSRVWASISTDINDSKYLDITLPPRILLGTNEEQSLTVRIRAKERTNETKIGQTITFTISYHASANESKVGEPLNVYLWTTIQGEKEEIDIGFTVLIVLGIFIIFVIALLVIYVVNRKRE